MLAIILELTFLFFFLRWLSDKLIKLEITERGKPYDLYGLITSGPLENYEDMPKSFASVADVDAELTVEEIREVLIGAKELSKHKPKKIISETIKKSTNSQNFQKTFNTLGKKPK